MSYSSEAVRRTGKLKTIKTKKTEKESGIDFKDIKDLMEEYENILKSIEEDDFDTVIYLIRSSDMKYFLVQNDLDYNIFRRCITKKKVNFIK